MTQGQKSQVYQNLWLCLLLPNFKLYDDCELFHDCCKNGIDADELTLFYSAVFMKRTIV